MEEPSEAERARTATHSTEDASNEEMLAKFRRDWRDEFSSSPKGPSTAAPSTALRVVHEESESESESEKEKERASEPSTSMERPEEDVVDEHQLLQQAESLYMEGAALERQGELFLAIRKYRKAEHLVPDVERIVCQTRDRKEEENKDDDDEVEQEEDELTLDDRDDDDDLDNEEDVNTSSVQDHLVDDFKDLQLNRMWCEPQQALTSVDGCVHIGFLPTEVILHLLRWVVSSDLDLISLERCAQVCRGFYLAARSPHIWRLVCQSTWGGKKKDDGVMNNLDTDGPLCWRTLYLSRPRLMFNGLYISRISYTREGERSFQDNEFARAWHLVAYYRYLRFLAGGHVAMVISSEQPNNAVKLMKRPFETSGGLQGISRGSFSTDGKLVRCILKKDTKTDFSGQSFRFSRPKRPLKHQKIYQAPEQEFHVELEIRGKRYNQLHWLKYEIVSRYSDGSESRSDIDVSHNFSFPRLIYSRVKSYTDQCSAPLN